MKSWFILTGLFFVCLDSSSVAKEEKRPKLVDTIRVRPTTVTQSVRIIGTVRPKKEAHLRSETSGSITLLIPSGTLVEKGTVLAHLENEDEEGEYHLSVSKERITHERYKRLKELHHSKTTSTKELEIAEKEWVDAKIALHRARKIHQKTLFVAPFPGTVGVWRILDGQTIKANDIIVSIYDTTTQQIELSISQNILPSIQVNHAIRAAGQSGHITSIQHVIDPETQMGIARAAIQAGGFCPGSTIPIDLVVTEKKDVFAVPHEAIFYKEGAPHVYRVRKGKAQHSRLKVGLRGDHKIQVLSGLKAEDEVILRGHSQLYPFAPVTTKCVNDPAL